MNSIYDTVELQNLHALKEAGHWRKQNFISGEQLTAIRSRYPSKLYHPNLAIRILLFIASCLAISGAAGIFSMMMLGAPEVAMGTMLLLAGLGLFYLVQKFLIEKNKHFRSGVVEAGAYTGCTYIVSGFGLLTDGNEHILFLVTISVCAYMSFRFLDLLCHIVGMLALAGFLFYESYQLGGIFRQVIPFVIIISFSIIYVIVRQRKIREDLALWSDNLKLTEIISLLFIYTGGNYLVVRECSIGMLDMNLAPGEDIPLAFLFWFITAGMPILLIYRGVRLGSITLIRLGVIMLALSVMTFRYYYSIAPPEVALTIAGLLMLGITAWLYNLLKTNRGVFTRDKLLSRQWVSDDVAAYAVSQTMGGNVVKQDETFKGGGGSFGGGGASGDF